VTGERVRRFAIAAAVVLTAGGATAQEAPPRDLARVYVQLADGGDEIDGHLVSLGPSQITLLVDGVRRDVSIDSVMKVQTRGDSVKNGALIGALISAVSFALVASEYGDAVLPGALVGTAAWAAIGAGVDALIPGRTTIYRKTGSDAVSASGPRAALAMKFRF